MTVILTYWNGKVRHIPDLPKKSAEQIVKHARVGKYFGRDNIIYPTAWLAGAKAA